MHSGPFGGQHLFLDAPHRQYVSAQGDFSGHGGQRADLLAGQQRHQRRDDGNACGRAVFLDRPRGNVNMDVMVGEKFFVNPKLRRVGTHPAMRGLHGLAHHVLNLAGDGKASFAFHPGRFDEQNVASRRRPGQSNDHSGPFGALGNLAFAADLNAPQKFLDDLLGHDQLFALAFRQPPRLLAADRAEIPFQAAHPGFPRVVADYVAHGFFRKLNLLGGDAVLFDLPGDQILERDVNLLFFRVSLQFDDLHAVAQRFRDRIEHIGGGDEQHLRQIERNVQIIIPERRVLFGVQGFQQGRRWVAAKIAPDLVDFVEHEDRILSLGPANTLNDLTRQRTDVGAAVSADFRLVVHAAQRQPDELAPQGARNRLAQRSLPYSRGPDKT